MLVDAFIFHDELDLLYLRLQELMAVVDRFVICEAPVTFSGHPKPLYFHENSRRFDFLAGRITHLVCHPAPTDDPWQRERQQRDYLREGLSGLAPADLVHVSDVDEIPRASVLAELKTANCGAALELDNYYYYLNLFTHNTIKGPFVAHALTLDSLTVSELRFRAVGECERVMHRAGWHFSYLGGESAIKKKLESFSHQEFNTQEIKDACRKNIRSRQDLFGRSWPQFTPVPVNETFPVYLQDNHYLYSSYLCGVD